MLPHFAESLMVRYILKCITGNDFQKVAQILLEGGPDTVENAIALCPNCHRKQHYG